MLYSQVKRTRMYLITLYALSNFFYCMYFSYTGNLGGDFSELEIDSNSEALFIALLVIFITWSFTGAIFYASERISIRSIYLKDKTNIDLLFVFIAIFHFYCVLNGYVTVANTQKPDVPLVFKLVLFAVPTLELLPIYLFYRVGIFNWSYFFVLFIFVVVNVLLAKTFILLVLYVLINVKLYVKHQRCFIKNNILVILLGMGFYPFIRAFKVYVSSYILMNGFDLELILNGYITYIYDGGAELYGDFLLISLERFQHVANVSYLIDNLPSAHLFFSNLNLLYIDTALTKLIYKYIFWSATEGVGVGQAFASFITSETATWNAHTGIAGLFFIDPVFFIFNAIFNSCLIFISVIIAKKIDSDSILNELSWSFVIIFIFHGWSSAYFSYVLALGYFLLIVIFVKMIRSNLRF